MNLTKPFYGIKTSYSSGPVFGGNTNNLYISDNSNINMKSYSKLSSDFRLSSFLLSNPNATATFLAGSYNFIPSEIEVFSTDRKSIRFSFIFVYTKKSLISELFCYEKHRMLAKSL